MLGSAGNQRSCQGPSPCALLLTKPARSSGVISGVGKGIIASSTGLLLKTTGLAVTSIKIDPYINIDAGTMAPTESVSAWLSASR